MRYLSLMKKQKKDAIAIVVDGQKYTYGEIVIEAEKLERKINQGKSEIEIYKIQEKTIIKQLLLFLALSGTMVIPVIMPEDVQTDFDSEYEIGENSCMAVMTSGTTGKPKLFFRTYESWAGYFEIQNKIFGIDSETRMFVQGSLAFTGNLNLYLSVFYAGGTIVAESSFFPSKWEEILKEEKVNLIYLIPTKLLLFPQIMKKDNKHILHIISGSQSLGKKDAEKLKKVFPKTKIILYYGASELNYITYLTDAEMTEKRNLIGKPFPNVKVTIQDGKLVVETKYHVQGITCPYTLNDLGEMDDEKNFYFLGRSDDILNVRGRKISAKKIEDILEQMDKIAEAAVYVVSNKSGKEMLAAKVVQEKNICGLLNIEEIRSELKNQLAHFEVPRTIDVVERLPKNESGKLLRKLL